MSKDKTTVTCHARTFEQICNRGSLQEWSDLPFIFCALVIHSRCTKETEVITMWPYVMGTYIQTHPPPPLNSLSMVGHWARSQLDDIIRLGWAASRAGGWRGATGSYPSLVVSSWQYWPGLCSQCLSSEEGFLQASSFSPEGDIWVLVTAAGGLASFAGGQTNRVISVSAGPPLAFLLSLQGCLHSFSGPTKSLQ